MSEQPEQVNFCCAVAEDKTMKLRDKVHWLHISADEYWAKFVAAQIALEAERQRADRLFEAVGLLNSMVLSGEQHSDESRAVVRAVLSP